MQETQTIEQPVKAAKTKPEREFKRSLGVMDIINTNFDYFELEQPWSDHLGKPATNFKMLVYGHPKNGKTSYLMQLTKYLASFTTVYYNSIEEGKSQTTKESLIRHNLQEVAGRWMLGDRDSYPEMVTKLKRKGSQHVVVIDSRDYMELTTKQYKRLEELFPNKAFIIVCWELAGRPAGKYAKDIEYMMDIIVHVENFKAHSRSRFGGFSVFNVWDKKPKQGQQLTFMDVNDKTTHDHY